MLQESATNILYITIDFLKNIKIKNLTNGKFCQVLLFLTLIIKKVYYSVSQVTFYGNKLSVEPQGYKNGSNYYK